MNDQIFKLLKKLLIEIDHYSTKKDFSQIIKFLSKKICNNPNIFNSILEKMIEDVKNSNLEEKALIEKRLYSFLTKNEKKYLNKIKNSDWVVYEYELYFDFYLINKKKNPFEILTMIFSNKKIIKIVIDGRKRTIKSLIQSDFELSETTKIVIAK